jgi:hypothetical protein
MAQQRQIVANDFLPEAERSCVALDEKAIGDHLEKYFMRPDNQSQTFVYSAPLGGPHLYCYAPSVELKRDYWTIVTMGMSGTKMRVPDDIEDGHLYAHAEVY